MPLGAFHEAPGAGRSTSVGGLGMGQGFGVPAGLDRESGARRLKRTGSIVRQVGQDLGRDVETAGLERHQPELPSDPAPHARRGPEPPGKGCGFLGGTRGVARDEGELGSERDAGTTQDDGCKRVGERSRDDPS